MVTVAVAKFTVYPSVIIQCHVQKVVMNFREQQNCVHNLIIFILLSRSDFKANDLAERKIFSVRRH